MLKLDLTKAAADFLTEREAKHARQIWNKIVSLMKDPKPADAQVLKGYSDYLRADTGEYRIIYKFDKECLRVVLVGKRNDDEVYKQFKRL